MAKARDSKGRFLPDQRPSETAQPPQRQPRGTIITFAEAARQIGVTRRTVSRWARDGLIPIVRHPSGTPAIYQEDFDRLYGAAKESQQLNAG